MFCFKNNKYSAFTLVEVLLYLGLFLLIISIVYPILILILNNYLISRSSIDFSNEIKNIFLTIQKEIFKSKSMNILTDWEIVFDQQNEQIGFFLTKPIYLDLKTNKARGFISNLSVGSISLSGDLYSVNLTSSPSCYTGVSTITSTISFSGYAWSPKIGWLKFRNSDGENIIYGVCKDINNELRGFAWNDIVGWISFNCLDMGICGSSNYKVIENKNYLYGYAWNDVIGWLIFDGQGGKVYLAKMNPYLYFVDLISDPRLFIEDLVFSQLGSSFKINLKVKGLAQTYNESETTIVLPFK